MTCLSLKEGGDNVGVGGLEQETLQKGHLSFILDTRCSEASHRGKGVLAKGSSLPQSHRRAEGSRDSSGNRATLRRVEKMGASV